MSQRVKGLIGLFDRMMRILKELHRLVIGHIVIRSHGLILFYKLTVLILLRYQVLRLRIIVSHSEIIEFNDIIIFLFGSSQNRLLIILKWIILSVTICGSKEIFRLILVLVEI